jgi:hypothetical protein
MIVNIHAYEPFKIISSEDSNVFLQIEIQEQPNVLPFTSLQMSFHNHHYQLSANNQQLDFIDGVQEKLGHGLFMYKDMKSNDTPPKDPKGRELPVVKLAGLKDFFFDDLNKLLTLDNMPKDKAAEIGAIRIIGSNLNNWQLHIEQTSGKNDLVSYGEKGKRKLCEFYCPESKLNDDDLITKLQNLSGNVEFIAYSDRAFVYCDTENVVYNNKQSAVLNCNVNEITGYFFQDKRKLKTEYKDNDKTILRNNIVKGLSQKNDWKEVFRQDPLIFLQLNQK